MTTPNDKFDFGSGVAGAMAGFYLGGPVGALLGAGVGYAASKGAKKLILPKTATTLSLMAGNQQITSTKGTVVGIIAPAGGRVTAMSPATGSAVGHLEVMAGQGFAAATGSGDINVLWSDPNGNAQSTVVSLTVS